MALDSLKQHSVGGIVAAASVGFVVTQLDVTIVNVALPAIGQNLDAGIAQLQWVVDAYSLVFAVLLLSAGVIGVRFGSRRAYLVGFWLFALASLACGLAPKDVAGGGRARACRVRPGRARRALRGGRRRALPGLRFAGSDRHEFCQRRL